MDLAINDVTMVTSEKVFKGSLGVDAGKIVAISQNPLDAETVIEGKGRYLFPGIVDNHVHLNDPGFTWREDFHHGTLAAAIGGVTTVVDMPLQNEPALSNAEIYQKKATHLEGSSYIDYSFWGALVNYNMDDLEGLRDAGVKAFKSFMCPVGKDYTSLLTGQIREAMGIVKSLGGLAGFHCEDFNIIAYEEQKARQAGKTTIEDYLKARPLIAESIATRNILELAQEQEADVHICHVSHRSVVDMVRAYRDKGVSVSLETCPHYLLFSEADVMAGDFSFKCSPPIREADNKEAMWDAVAKGYIDCIVSDHSPSHKDEKAPELGAFDAWGGISGLQTGLQTLFSEGVIKRGLSPTFIAYTMAQRPAELFGLGHCKGQIALGYDADFVLLDPDKTWEITQESLAYKNQFSAFCGLKGRGLPVMTILRGTPIVVEGQATDAPKKGQLLSGVQV